MSKKAYEFCYEILSIYNQIIIYRVEGLLKKRLYTEKHIPIPSENIEEFIKKDLTESGYTVKNLSKRI